MIDELAGRSVGQLRERYAEVFGEPSRSGNRRWLIRRIAWRLQAMAEGDLTERARRRAEELARDEDLRVRPPKDRGPELGANLRTVSGRIIRRVDDRVPMPGTVLTRVFKGVEHRVTVLPHGFEHEGRVHRSLSAAAHAISGSHWNGFHFFGLTKPRARSGSKETA
ncbi:MAG: DUF2924 domain-containing protein [Phycisphaeraceae bacterium]|nr:DUF2924 domain-containing protein [Phycisphaeraceae bacterium]MCB9848764.1 DUF2924 domain-containing protein [Phycisphaeraceae bacterium]